MAKPKFSELKEGDKIYRLKYEFDGDLPVVTEENVIKVLPMPSNEAIRFMTDVSPECVVLSDRSFQRWISNAVSTNMEDINDALKEEYTYLIQVNNRRILDAKEEIVKIQKRLSELK